MINEEQFLEDEISTLAADVRRLKAENERLRYEIRIRSCPHYAGKGPGMCSDCECWKVKALEAKR